MRQDDQDRVEAFNPMKQQKYVDFLTKRNLPHCFDQEGNPTFFPPAFCGSSEDPAEWLHSLESMMAVQQVPERETRCEPITVMSLSTRPVEHPAIALSHRDGPPKKSCLTFLRDATAIQIHAAKLWNSLFVIRMTHANDVAPPGAEFYIRAFEDAVGELQGSEELFQRAIEMFQADAEDEINKVLLPYMKLCPKVLSSALAMKHAVHSFCARRADALANPDRVLMKASYDYLTWRDYAGSPEVLDRDRVAERMPGSTATWLKKFQQIKPARNRLVAIEAKLALYAPIVPGIERLCGVLAEETTDAHLYISHANVFGVLYSRVELVMKNHNLSEDAAKAMIAPKARDVRSGICAQGHWDSASRIRAQKQMENLPNSFKFIHPGFVSLMDAICFADRAPGMSSIVPASAAPARAGAAAPAAAAPRARRAAPERTAAEEAGLQLVAQ